MSRREDEGPFDVVGWGPFALLGERRRLREAEAARRAEVEKMVVHDPASSDAKIRETLRMGQEGLGQLERLSDLSARVYDAGVEEQAKVPSQEWSPGSFAPMLVKFPMPHIEVLEGIFHSWTHADLPGARLEVSIPGSPDSALSVALDEDVVAALRDSPELLAENSTALGEALNHLAEAIEAAKQARKESADVEFDFETARPEQRGLGAS